MGWKFLRQSWPELIVRRRAQVCGALVCGALRLPVDKALLVDSPLVVRLPPVISLHFFLVRPFPGDDLEPRKCCSIFNFAPSPGSRPRIMGLSLGRVRANDDTLPLAANTSTLDCSSSSLIQAII
jgi:hypothetical protein